MKPIPAKVDTRPPRAKKRPPLHSSGPAVKPMVPMVQLEFAWKLAEERQNTTEARL